MADAPSQASGGPGSLPASQLPWQQIPKFEAGVTDLNDYTKKLEFLHSIWPAEHVQHLAPRAVLNLDPISFKKVSNIGASKLKTEEGVQHLIRALGGQWGRLQTEDKYEKFEKALYLTSQKRDESNDSYLARHDINFEDLLLQKVTIQEIRAYILLRQSVLSSEEKKRVIMDCKGDLTYESVRNSIRLLGSKFFQDLQGQAKIRTKTYDTNVAHESTEMQSTFTSETVEEIDEDQIFQVLWEQGDPDATFIHDFEEQIIDTLQESPEIASCFSAYQDARARLRERARNRGFWPSKFNSGFKGKKGNSKGKKGKGFHRQTLAERIATSACKICDQVGHWKRECPLRGQESTGQAQTNSEMITMTEDLDSEQIQELIDELPEGALDMSTQVGKNFENCRKRWHGLRECESEGEERHERLDSVWDEFCFWVGEEKMMSQMSDRLSECCRKHGLTSSCSRPTSPPAVCQPSKAVLPFDVSHVGHQANSDLETCEEAIIDTGASRTVIGRSRVDALVEAIGGHVKKVSSSCVFRFGNNGTLQSQFALLFARRKQGWLRVEVVPGTTPFLISNRVLKGLRCMVDEVS